MNIKDFENEFEGKILKRGFEYYKNNSIISLECISENKYFAEVEGSELYEVTIDIDENRNVEEISCDCPYDMGEYCKHEAAVLYALREKFDSINQNKDLLPQLLEKCSKSQLFEIIFEYTQENKTFRDYLRFKLSDINNVDKIVLNFKCIANRFFEGYTYIDDFLKAGDILFDKVEKFKNSVDKIKVYSRIITIFEKHFDDYDNIYEDWEFYDIIERCSSNIKVLAEILIKNGNKNDIDLIWNYLIESWNGEDKFNGEDHLFPSLLQFSVFPEYRKKLDELLLCQQTTSSEYEIKGIDKRRYEIIKNYGTENEMYDFINNHLEDSYFRLIAIENAISLKDFEKAEKLSLDGEKFDFDKKGLVNKWKHLRYDIYKLSKNDKKLVEVCLELIKDGDTEFYQIWKTMISEEDFDKEIKNLINKCCYTSYEYIVSYENMYNEIYKICAENPKKIISYYVKLKESEYKDKGRLLFENYIYEQAKTSANRSEYNFISRLLKKYSEQCGAENARVIAENFHKLYCRKPAFMDELKKIGF